MVDFSPSTSFATANSARIGAVSAPSPIAQTDARIDFREEFDGASERPHDGGRIRRSAREELSDGASSPEIPNAQVASNDLRSESSRVTESAGDGAVIQRASDVSASDAQKPMVVADARAQGTSPATRPVFIAQLSAPTTMLDAPDARLIDAVPSAASAAQVESPFAVHQAPSAHTPIEGVEAAPSPAPSTSQLSPRESTQALQVALSMKSPFQAPSPASAMEVRSAPAQSQRVAQAQRSSTSPSALALEMPFTITVNSFARPARIDARIAPRSATAARASDAPAVQRSASAEAIASRVTAVEAEIASANRAGAAATTNAEQVLASDPLSNASIARVHLSSAMSDGASALPAAIAAAQESAFGSKSVAALAPEFASIAVPDSHDGAMQTNGKLVARGLAALTQQRGGTLSIRLDPPELGAVQVKMVMEQGSVRVDFRTATPEARAVLEMHLGALRSALETQGLYVDRLQVESSSTQSAHQRNATAEQASSPFAMSDRRAPSVSNTHQDAAGDRSHQQESSARHDGAQGESRGRRESSSRAAHSLAADAIPSSDSFASALLHGARS